MKQKIAENIQKKLKIKNKYKGNFFKIFHKHFYTSEDKNF